ncbi:MAG: EAL domain-containing protein [Oscillospiraceae bacterium]
MYNNKIFSRTIMFSVAIIIMLALITMGLFLYRSKLKEDLTKANCETLNYIVEQQKFTFMSKLNDQKIVIKAYADSLCNASKLNDTELIRKIENIRKNSTFDFMTYVKPNGEAIENTGTHINISDREYFQKALKCQTVIANPMDSKVTGENVVVFATPILCDGGIKAVLVGGYDTKNLSRLMTTSFNGKGRLYISTSDGEIVAKNQDISCGIVYDNIFLALDTVEFKGEDNKEAIISNIKEGKSGHSRYIYNNEEMLMHYSPSGINDWYIFSVAPNMAIAAQTMSIMYNATMLTLFIACMIVLLSIFLFIIQRHHLNELQKIAFDDTLTGFPNKRRFMLSAVEILDNAYSQYAFIILDIDKFKVLNDKLGYNCGDSLLMSMAKIINSKLLGGECFGRCDSDEFYILLKHTNENELNKRAENIISEIEDYFREELNSIYNLVLSMGIYVVANPHESINGISDKARLAHRLAKGKGESRIVFFSEEIRNKIMEEKEIENKMQQALENEEFLVYLQPKYYLDSEKICGAEALARWENRDLSLVYPGVFIPIFEKNGFITRLDMYMLKKTCQIIKNWLDAGITPVPISINFSRVHLKNPQFVDDIANIVKEYQIPPRFIEVELTESTILDNESVLIDVLTNLHEYGFTLSMDDFGSGYSSLGLLKNLPVDVIKLDRTFFVNYKEQSRAVAVIEGVVAIANVLGIETVAEGVETKEQVEFLKKLGCNIVQGYYFAKPMPEIEVTQLLERNYNSENS